MDPNADTLPSETDARDVAKDMPNFKNKPSEIELTLDSIGIEVVFTPKAHCELSGRGVECSWVV